MRNIMVLSQVKNKHESSDDYWIFAASLNLSGYVYKEWNKFTLSVDHVGVLLSNQSDCIASNKNNYNGKVTIEHAYNVNVEEDVTCT